MLQTKEFACARHVKTVEDIALENKRKGRIVTILSMQLFSGMAVYFIFFSVCYITVLVSQFSPKISGVDFRLFLKNSYSYFRVTFLKTPLVAGIFLCGC